MAIDFNAEIEALKLAVSSGAMSVEYDGKKVTYGSRVDLLARLRWLQQQQAGGTLPARPSAGFATFDRGDN
jgi:hypothetical protein